VAGPPAPAVEDTIALWIKLGYTAMAAVVVPVYAVRYGWRNFLWFSDIALVATGVALWLESALLASMMAVGVLLPELLWSVSFLGRLLFGLRVTDLAGYMFDPAKPRYLRALSLFHLVLPVALLWLVARLGYDTRAFVAQTVLAWIVLPVTYAVVRPHDENINWVYGPGPRQSRLSPRTYLVLLMLSFPTIIYLPTHFALKTWFSVTT
jgi:hypothetical protein